MGRDENGAEGRRRRLKLVWRSSVEPVEEPGSVPLPFHPVGEVLACLDSLYTTAVHLEGDPARAQELVRQTCLRAWRSWPSLQSGTSFKAWLFALMHKTARIQRRRFFRPTFWSDIPLEKCLNQPELLDAAHSRSEARADQHETRRELEAAMKELPVPLREVVLLMDLEGFTLTEVSRILATPPGTVASRLYRAHCFLRMRVPPPTEGEDTKEGSS